MRRVVLICLIPLALSGCASRAATVTPHDTSAGDGVARMAGLRLALARNPTSVGVNRSLAWLQIRRGRPGAALAHFELLARRGALRRADREQLAALYIRRARARMQLGDADSYRDLQRALRLHRRATVDPTVRARANEMAALATLMMGGDGARKAAAAHLSASNGPRAQLASALSSPDASPLPQLGTAAQWVYESGAREAGLYLLERFAARGGTTASVLATLVAARLWWRGESPRVLIMDRLGDAVDRCLVATDLPDFGCGDTVNAASGSARHSAALRARAHDRLWQDERPANAAAWVVIALRARMSGAVSSWSAEVATRVDVRALSGAALAAVPPWALPTLLRVAGNLGAAHAAADAAAAQAARLRPIERAVLLAELVVQGRPGAVIDRVLTTGMLEDTGLLVAATHVRQRAGAAPGVDAPYVARMSPAVRHEYFVRRGDLGPLATARGDDAALARWYHAATQLGLAVGRDELMRQWNHAPGNWDDAGPFGVVDPRRVHGAADRAWDVAIIAIARAYVRAPSRADRLAEDLIDRGIAIGVHGPRVARLFAALGDPVRADALWRRIAEASPRHAPYRLAAGISAASVGDLPRAELLITGAMAASGDPGATARAATRALVGLGQHLSALAVGKRALELTSRPYQGEALVLVARAALALGRDDVATGALVRLAQLASPANRTRAMARAASHWPGTKPRPAALSAADAANPTASPSADALLWNMSAAATTEAGTARLLAIAVSGSATRAEHALALLGRRLASPAARALVAAERRSLSALRWAPLGASSR